MQAKIKFFGPKALKLNVVLMIDFIQQQNA